MDRNTTYFAGPGIVRAQLQIFDYAAAGVALPHAWSPALRAAMLLVAVTGYGDRADVAAALDAGFDHHLVKPVEPRRLGKLLAAFAAR